MFDRHTLHRKALTSKKGSYWSSEGSSILSYGYTVFSQFRRIMNNTLEIDDHFGSGTWEIWIFD
jgi:hypothetical protein